MKKALLKLLAMIAILALLAVPVYCGDHDDDDDDDHGGGFSGMIHLGGAFMSTKSHLEADEDNKKIDSLDQDADSASEFQPMPFFDLRYGFESGTSVYIGIPLKGEPRAETGITQQIPGFGSLGMQFHYYMPEEVWKDPYLTGVDRKETDMSMFGGGLSCEAGDFEIAYEYDDIGIDDDLIGKRYESLKREGSIHTLSFEYEIQAGSGMIVPGFTYQLADLDGKSNSYDSYEGELAYMRGSQDYMLLMALGGGMRQYDKSHPIFEKEREDTVYEAMAMVAWLNPFGLDSFSLNVGAAYEKEDSNIDFYDADEMIGFMTFGYHWGADGMGHDDDDDD